MHCKLCIDRKGFDSEINTYQHGCRKSVYARRMCVFFNKEKAASIEAVKVSTRCSGWKSIWFEAKMCDTHWTLTHSLLFHPLNTLKAPSWPIQTWALQSTIRINEKPIVESNWNGNTAQKGCALRNTNHMYQPLSWSPGFHIGPNSQTKGWEACQWLAAWTVKCITWLVQQLPLNEKKVCVVEAGILKIITQQPATGWQALLFQWGQPGAAWCHC